MADKSIYHGATYVVEGASNPPPYSAAPPPPGFYNPPPGQYGQPITQGPVGHATIGTAVVPIIVTQQMGPNPTRITCRSCQADIVTRVEVKPAIKTHLTAALLCLFGCWPCVCIPYCIDSCMNTDHYCPNCNSYVGSYLS